MPPFAQMNAFRMEPEHFAAYVGLTVAFLFVAWIVDKPKRPLGTSLILWGIQVVILSCGYALIGVPTLAFVTPALTKIGFLLALGGVAWSLLAVCPNMSPTKETDDV